MKRSLNQLQARSTLIAVVALEQLLSVAAVDADTDFAHAAWAVMEDLLTVRVVTTVSGCHCQLRALRLRSRLGCSGSGMSCVLGCDPKGLRSEVEEIDVSDILQIQRLVSAGFVKEGCAASVFQTGFASTVRRFR